MRFSLHAGNALVHAQALVLFFDVVVGDADIEAEIELDFGDFHSLLALHLSHGALEHLGVEFETHGFNVAGLLAAE